MEEGYGNQGTVYTVYAGTIWGGCVFTEPFGNGFGVYGVLHVYQGRAKSSFLLGEPSGAYLLLFSHVLQESHQAVRGKPAVSRTDSRDPKIFCPAEKSDGPAQDASHLQLSLLQAKNSCSQGTWPDRDQLSQVSYPLY